MAVLPTFATTSIVCGLAAVVCAWRIFDQKLARLYPAFTAYVISQALLLPLTSFVGAASKLYFRIFIVAYPIIWLVYSFMVKELFAQVFRKYPGIAMFGRMCVYLAIALAVAFAFASQAITRGVLVKESAILIPIEVVGRNVVFGMAICVIILMIMLSIYPLELHRNVFVNCIVFSALLLGEAGQLLADQLTNLGHTQFLNVLLMIFNIVCFSTWGFLLSSQGEREIIYVHPAIKPNDERRLLAQLDALNALGVRAARK